MNKKIILALAFLTASTHIYAGEQTGQITSINVRASDNLHLFYLNGSSSNKPACATHTYWIIKSEDSPAGRSQLSILLAAQAQGKSIQVKGAGTCTRWQDGEDVDTIIIK